MLRVPHESMRRNFKHAQKFLERESQYLTAAAAELRQNPTPEKIDEMERRLKGLRAKLANLGEEQDRLIDKARERAEFLDEASKINDMGSLEYETWSKKRLDVLLVDYLLRSGYVETGMRHAESREIQQLVDSDVLLQCSEIERSLRERDTARCLEWCQENKVQLRKTRSPLEFEVRLQQFIELARTGNAGQQAAQYFQKYLGKSNDPLSSQAMQACGLLVYRPDTDVSPYKELYSVDRWNMLADMFVRTYLNLHGLAINPALIVSLTSGISALKTYSCVQKDDQRPKKDLSRGYMCPVCSDELNKLSRPLPYAHHVRSILDPDPVVLPNDHVHGRAKLFEYARKKKLPPNKVCEPSDHQVFLVEDLKTVYPS